MSSSKFIKYLAGYRCQICGDEDGKSYESGVRVELQAHHIIPSSKGGQRKIENLVALCDFCHAVVTPHCWEEYFGLTKNKIDISEMEKNREIFVYDKAYVKIVQGSDTVSMPITVEGNDVSWSFQTLKQTSLLEIKIKAEADGLTQQSNIIMEVV